ncbi:SDR family NAD(P)-dependent oxidoreductase [bacterium]|nr:SDR family NAD(P)-dependent oxidoreductase [bacterium]
MIRQRFETGPGDELRNSSARPDVPVAIVGMACILPQANSPENFWSNILEGKDCVREVPLTHWMASDYFDEDPKSPDKTYSRRGAFIDPVDFAPLDFGIAPKNLEAIDTTQLLGMVVARDALVDSGYGAAGKTFDRNRASVILGVTGTLEMVIPLGARLGHPIWRKSLAECGVDPETADKVVDRIGAHYVSWQENSFPGLLGNVTAGRIANRLDLGGTNCVVDAACASSLGAVHLAVMELAAGRSDMVISGGFDTFNDIFMFMCFSKTPALSKSGHARPFDVSADGTSLGEGLGAIVLKRLDDAQRDGDRIYAVIRGVGSSSDGIGQAVYAPKAEGQVRCLKAAYEVAGVDPATVELIEAHGTGTKVGDGIEVKALAEVFGAARAGRDVPACAIGSVKSQIGHTKAAAGIAGLIKAALALRHKVIPPTIKVDSPAEELAQPGGPFYVSVAPRPWPARPEHPRRAGVSAFGFGGSNFHAVLEEFPNTADDIAWSPNVDLLTISAGSVDDLRKQVEAIPADVSWDDFRRLAARSRAAAATQSAARLAVVIKADQDRTALKNRMIEAVEALRSGKPLAPFASEGIFPGSGTPQGQLAILFAGQGAQSPGMLRDAACRFPEVARTLQESDAAAGRKPGELVSKIYPVNQWTEEARRQAAAELTRTEIAQPALAALELGLARQLAKFGVAPHAVAGHSLGELVALASVGRLSPATIHEVVELRGRAMARAATEADRRYGPGGMTAILAPENAWIDALELPDLRGRVFVANRNSPSQTVVAGAVAGLDALERVLAERGLRYKRLEVASAFHSPWVEPASDELARKLATTRWNAVSRQVWSNTTAQPYPAEGAEASRLLSRQLALPVDFVGMIRGMEADGCRHFLEIGPDARLTGLVRSCLAQPASAEVFAFAESPADTPARSIIDLARTLGRIWAAGFPVDLSNWAPVATASYLVDKPRKLTVPLAGANLKPTIPPAEPVPAKKAVQAVAAIPARAEAQPAAEPVARLNPTGTNGTSGTIVKVKPASTSAPLANGSRSTKIENFERKDVTSGKMPAGVPARAAQAPVDSPATSPLTRNRPQDRSRMTPKEHPVHADQSRRPNDSRQEALTALRNLMEQTAAVHAQFLATQRHAQETVRMILTGQTGAEDIAVAPVQPAPVAVQPQALFRTPEPVAPAAVAAPVAEPVFAEVVTRPVPTPSTVYRATPNVVAPPVSDVPQPVFPATPAPVPVRHAEPPKVATPVAPAVSAPPVQAAPAPSPASSSANLLLQVVAEKTGYPIEMLELDQQLDADLGIDSIKRVEILSAIQERRSDLPHVRTDQFGALRTLGDVVGLLDSLQPGAGAATAHAVSAPALVAAEPQPAVRSSDAGSRFRSLSALLCEVVAEKTGYPVEMLEMDQQLDTDLGIDSIKRVEILSAIQERIPNLPHIRTDQFGSLMTLGDIVRALVEISPDGPDDDGPGAGGGGGGSSERAPVRGEARQVQTSNVRTSRLTIGSLDNAPRNRYQPGPGDEIWVVDDGSEFVASLTSVLKMSGAHLRTIPNDDAAIDRIDPPERLTGLVLNMSDAYDDAAFGRVLRLVARLSRPLQETGRGRFAFVAGLTRLNGCFGLETDTDAEELAGWPTAALSGLVKTLAWEWPDVAARVFDIDPRWAEWQPAAAAEQVAAELFMDGPVERGFSDRDIESPVTPILEPIVRETAADIRRMQDAIRPGDLVIVTGGARGVTAQVAAALAEVSQPTLLLLGRSPEPAAEPEHLRSAKTEAELISTLVKTGGPGKKPAHFVQEAKRILADREVRDNLDRLRGLASQVVYRPVDLQDAGAVASAIAATTQSFGPVRGVIHGAGVLADKRVEDLAPEAAAPVLRTKVRGMLNLLGAIDANDLRFFAVFSSITARVGRVGQAAYAAANEMLNKLTIDQSRRYPGCRWLSLGWGPWDGGMVTPALKKVFSSEGVGLIPLESGSWTLLELIGAAPQAEPCVEVSVLEGDGRLYTPNRAVPGGVLPRPASHQGTPLSATAGDPARVVWQRPCDLAEWPALRHHVIDGSAVVPTAMLTEWMIEAAMQVIPGLELAEVRNMSVLKGVVLDDSGPASLQACIKSVDYAASGLVTAKLAIQGLYPRTGRTLDQATAEIVLAPTPAVLDPNPAFESRATPAHAAQPYAQLLFHGPAFQGLAGEVRFDAAQFHGVLKGGSRPAEWDSSPSRARWVVDPLVLDVVMQGICSWPRLTGDRFSLPMGYRRLVWRPVAEEALAGGTVRLTLRRKNDFEVEADAVVRDAYGQVAGIVEGIRGVMDTRLEQAFRRNALPQVERR